MSVTGEFQRVSGECVAFLRRCGGDGAEAWVEEFASASHEAASNLSRAARRALAALETTQDAPPFGSDLEHEEFVRLREHLTAICHAILGR